MGITRSGLHKRRPTGGKRKLMRKKRKFELGRPPAMTKLGAQRVRTVRCRGGALKHRALRLDSGNFSWGSEVCTRRTRIVAVVYNASNNELVRTNTLVKNCIVQVDATPFRLWYEKTYGLPLGKKGKAVDQSKLSETVLLRQKQAAIEKPINDQFNTGRLLACISSRPGQTGRCDGYILEGKELEFYSKKLQKKKSK